MSDNQEVECGNCHATSSLEVRAEFDGCCWSCGQEIGLEQCPREVMGERNLLQMNEQSLQDHRAVRQTERSGLAAAVRAYLSAIDNGLDDYEIRRARVAMRQALAAGGSV